MANSRTIAATRAPTFEDEDVLASFLEDGMVTPAPQQLWSISRGSVIVVSWLMGVAAVVVIGNGFRGEESAGMNGAALADIEGKAEQVSTAWQCHRYADGQDDAWCKSAGTTSGIEYKFVGFGANVCADCWCCKRPASDAVAEVRTLKTSTDSAAAPTPAATPTTSEPTPQPTPAPTPSKEAETLMKVQRKAHNMSLRAAAAVAKAKQQAKDLIAEATRRGQKLIAKGDRESQLLMHDAVSLEAAALEKAAENRICVDLPGTKLPGRMKLALEAAVIDSNITASENCTFWCKAHDTCQQAVFSVEEGPICEWFGELSEDPMAFGESFSSSYCGSKAQEDDLIKKVKRVFKKKPWVPENPNCAWAGDDCSASRCCANTCAANMEFTECSWYTCYQKDEYYAGCQLGGAPQGWNGTRLGGHATMEVGKAPDGVLTQGTKLFCFCVVTWDAGPTMPGADGEGVVVNGWKSRGLGIMQCDEHAFFDGLPTGSVHNIDSFASAWEHVKQDGRWKFNDWTVKVDGDAVFFPERLRWHIDELRTPMGSRVYLRNTYFKFNFLGALEVLTREAVQLLFERSWQCDQHVGREGGEDYWLLQCLEGIGVNYQSDYQLLVDKYAAQNDCYSDWAVAFHFYKSVDSWIYCHDSSQQVWENNHANSELVMK